jgi:hypothetical protein
MKRIYLSERDAHTLELAGHPYSGDMRVSTDPFPPRQQTVEYVAVTDVQPLIDALEEAVKWSEFPDLEARWARVINAFDAKTFR